MKTADKMLQDAIQLRALLEMEQDDDAGGLDLLLLTMLDVFIRDQQFIQGLVQTPYSDELQRRIFLRQTLHTADKILDLLNEQEGDDPLPPAAIGLCKFLFEITFAAFLAIQSIEAAHPSLAETFEAERKAYTATREEFNEHTEIKTA